MAAAALSSTLIGLAAYAGGDHQLPGIPGFLLTTCRLGTQGDQAEQCDGKKAQRCISFVFGRIVWLIVRPRIAGAAAGT
jgi:hypothetical protein